MEFGLFIGGWVPDYLDGRNDAYEHERLINETRIAEAGDRSNWKYVWVTEHHFLAEYSHISANEIVMPHILARTERIRVASGIINVTPPVNHPARIAERVAMLDHLSGGRFDFGTGRGSSTTEQAGFGITDPDLTKEMFDEVMPEFRKMWGQDSYSFDGRFFSMPERNVLPKPYVKPHPPMWVAAGNPDTFEKAAKLGLGVICFTGGNPEKMRPLVELYKETIKDADPVGDYVNDNVAISTSFMCLEDGDAARDWMTKSRNGRQQSLVFKYLDTFPKPPGIPEWPERDPRPHARAAGHRPPEGRLHRRHPRRLRRGAREVGGHRRRPAHHGPHRQRVALRARRGVASSCSATRSSPSSTPTLRPAPPASAARPASASASPDPTTTITAVRRVWTQSRIPPRFPS